MRFDARETAYGAVIGATVGCVVSWMLGGSPWWLVLGLVLAFGVAAASSVDRRRR